jgi:hypothetical protein
MTNGIRSIFFLLQSTHLQRLSWLFHSNCSKRRLFCSLQRFPSDMGSNGESCLKFSSNGKSVVVKWYKWFTFDVYIAWFMHCIPVFHLKWNNLHLSSILHECCSSIFVNMLSCLKWCFFFWQAPWSLVFWLSYEQIRRVAGTSSFWWNRCLLEFPCIFYLMWVQGFCLI